MAEIPVATGTGKGLFTGPRDNPAYDGPVRHHPMHSCLNLVLRVLTALATAAAVVTMLKSSQTTETVFGYSTARWKDFPAFKWFVIANAVVFVYAVLAAVIAFFSLCVRRGPLSYSPSAWLTFLVDFLLASALISASAAALAVAWIGRHGQPTAQWPMTCNFVNHFCDYVQGALIASFCGYGFLALSTLLAVSALHHLARRRF